MLAFFLRLFLRFFFSVAGRLERAESRPASSRFLRWRVFPMVVWVSDGSRASGACPAGHVELQVSDEPARPSQCYLNPLAWCIDSVDALCGQRLYTVGSGTPELSTVGE